MNSPASDFPTLWKVIDRLDQASILYMLTGSMALNFYGHARATNDLDLVIQVSNTDASKLAQLFAGDFYVSKEAIQEAINTQRMFNVIDNETVFKVDFIIAKNDSYSKQQFERRQKISVDSHGIYVISPEDLILSKLEWSQESRSEIQENDVRNIIRVIGKSLDRNYLEKWAKDKKLYERLNNLYETA